MLSRVRLIGLSFLVAVALLTVVGRALVAGVSSLLETPSACAELLDADALQRLTGQKWGATEDYVHEYSCTRWFRVEGGAPDERVVVSLDFLEHLDLAAFESSKEDYRTQFAHTRVEDVSFGQRAFVVSSTLPPDELRHLREIWQPQVRLYAPPAGRRLTAQLPCDGVVLNVEVVSEKLESQWKALLAEIEPRAMSGCSYRRARAQARR